MFLFKISSFFKTYGDDLAFIVILLVVMFFFLKEFKITSKSSWGVLLGIIGLGGLIGFKMWRRKKLFEDLERREKALEDLEKQYNELLNEQKITKEAYDKAMDDLERAKKDAAISVSTANEEYEKEVAEIEKEYGNMSGAEAIRKAKELVQS